MKQGQVARPVPAIQTATRDGAHICVPYEQPRKSDIPCGARPFISSRGDNHGGLSLRNHEPPIHARGAHICDPCKRTIAPPPSPYSS